VPAQLGSAAGHDHAGQSPLVVSPFQTLSNQHWAVSGFISKGSR
jgi:hypothetical protein